MLIYRFAPSTNRLGRENRSIDLTNLFIHSLSQQTEREVVVTTSDKIAEVGRIERQPESNPTVPAAASTETESEMQAMMVTQSAWNEERRTV